MAEVAGLGKVAKRERRILGGEKREATEKGERAVERLARAAAEAKGEHTRQAVGAVGTPASSSLVWRSLAGALQRCPPG